MNDLTVSPPAGKPPATESDHHKAVGDAFAGGYTALLRERDKLLERVDTLVAERGELLARISELTRANDQKDQREAASMEREAALHAKTSHLAATVEIVRDALEKALAVHKS